MPLSSLLRLLTQRKLAYPYSLFFGFFGGSLITFWLTAYMFNYRQLFQYHYISDNFGQIMATMTARQAMDAILNHDHLSLQILLEDITQHQVIINAAVYDVENKLIVQAGEKVEGLKKNIRHFNAPITLHDTISGHVMLTININPSNSIRYTLSLILFTGVLAGLAGLFWYRGLYRATTKPQDTQNELQAFSDTDWPTEELKNNSSSKLNHTILLTLDIINADVLYQKLNNHSRKSIIDQLSQHIQKALSLYNGDLVYIGRRTIVLSFREHHTEQNESEPFNAIFNAVCCGYIIRELNKKENHIPLMVTARIHHAPKKTISADEQSQLINYNYVDDTVGLALEKILLKDSELTSYFLINSKEDYTNFVDIQGFQPTYANLLDNQLKRLRNIDG